jgi:hypothetical protein
VYFVSDVGQEFWAEPQRQFFFKVGSAFAFFGVAKKFFGSGGFGGSFFWNLGFVGRRPGGALKQKMRVRYDYLKHKFGFRELSGMCVQFSRLRPANCSTIRLSQLAQLNFRQPRPFDALVNSVTMTNLNWIRQVGVSPFWQTHYSFEKESSKRSKLLSRSFFELLLINTLIPIRFAYT